METDIFLKLALMLAFAIAGFALSRRLGQPVSVGTIVMGIILGPSVLSIVAYDDIISVIAQLGSIVLLFVAGLNSNIREIYTKKNFYVAFWGCILPLIGGLLTGILFKHDFFTSLFIGTTLTATCLGITSAVLKEIGKIKTETAKAMIGAAVIDDILSLSLLSIVLGIPSEASMLDISIKLMLVGAFVLIMIIFGERVLTWLMDQFSNRVIRHAPKLSFVFGLSLVFLISYAAQLLGLAPIIGAFLAGVSLSGCKSINTLLAGSEYFEIVFTSIFFISIGIVVELKAFMSLFWFIAVLTAVAILTKVIGSGVPAYRMGFSRKDALIVGVGMSPRGEVAFIIALNGLLLGMITAEVYSAIVFMSFLTTVITLVLLRALYKSQAGKHDSQEVDFIDLKLNR
jgi:Kef-type K+ transport system membrane component KefB